MFVSLLCFLPRNAHAYRVSGVVEFTYNSYQTKSGNNVTSDLVYWTQNYSASLQSHIWDPRVLQFTAGIGYSVYSYKDKPGADSFNYNLFTSFFPGMKVSWDLFDSKTTQNFESTSTISGYDLTTTQYGASLYLNLAQRANGNNNNGRNYTNNNIGRYPFPLPNINLSYRHAERESSSTAIQLNETRDNTSGSIMYRLTPNFYVSLGGGLEDYKNQVDQSSYKTQTVNLSSTARLTPDAELRINGNLYDRKTENISGFKPDDKSQNFNVYLDVDREKKVQQYYKYEFQEREDTTQKLATQLAKAEVRYVLTDVFFIRGGLEYSRGDYSNQVTGEESKLTTGGGFAGFNYLTKYAPDFLGPFVLTTAYEFGAGYSSFQTTAVTITPNPTPPPPFTIDSTPTPTGGGPYVKNSVSFDLQTEKWKNEFILLGYSYSDKYDNSPMNNDMWQHQYRLSMYTNRVPRTTVHGGLTYTSMSDQNQAAGVFMQSTFQDSLVQRRSLNFYATIDHALTWFANLRAGASRGTSAGTTVSLSTLGLTPAGILASSRDTLYFGEALVNYPITRNLSYRAVAREEFARSIATESTNYDVKMYLDFRIRMIYINFEYRWRQEHPENKWRTEQQLFYAKLSRPF